MRQVEDERDLSLLRQRGSPRAVLLAFATTCAWRWPEPEILRVLVSPLRVGFNRASEPWQIESLRTIDGDTIP